MMRSNGTRTRSGSMPRPSVSRFHRRPRQFLGQTLQPLPATKLQPRPRQTPARPIRPTKRRPILSDRRPALMMIEPPARRIEHTADIPNDICRFDQLRLARPQQRMILTRRLQPERQPRHHLGKHLIAMKFAAMRRQDQQNFRCRHGLRLDSLIHHLLALYVMQYGGPSHASAPSQDRRCYQCFRGSSAPHFFYYSPGVSESAGTGSADSIGASGSAFTAVLRPRGFAGLSEMGAELVVGFSCEDNFFSSCATLASNSAICAADSLAARVASRLLARKVAFVACAFSN